ncbi:TSUP family transporter [Myxococcota bacterium]|nr:TSUP family transporter [Myxococcota bacterium]
MDYLLITLTALIVSGLTLFSGFGLGTLLTPAFAVFFPVPTAIAATAVVHLSTNLFKLALLGKQADWRVVVRFSVPAALAALIGAATLVGFSELPALIHYQWAGRTFEVTPVKLLIGSLIVLFACLELSSAFDDLAVPPKFLPLGGLLSGFFGGLSGNQGALRSAFLIRAGLDKEGFVATGVVSAVIVDCVRLTVYGVSYFTTNFRAVPPDLAGLVLAATLAAFIGAFFGRRLLRKVTLRTVQLIVASWLIVVGGGLAAGIL